ncbi:MAG TPA: hypothetical protein VK991_04620, partial [Halomonas sp.]|nr:hypothetical protein [Halomonas sp.]
MSYSGAGQGEGHGASRDEASPGSVLAVLLASAGMAVLVLLIPSPLAGLGALWRWPLVALGIWGVGAGLMGPLAMDMSHAGLRAFSHGWPSRVALGLFSLCWCLLWL